MARYALVIGIAEYKNSLLRLPKTTTDAEAVVQVLKKYGDFQQVIRFPQRWNQDKNDYEMAAKPVTGAELGQALRKFLLEQAVGDDALIYFTGHGIKVSDNLGQEKGYLATSDCAIATEGNKIIGQQNAISLDSLNELIRDSNLRSLVLLLDCCHSGYFLERQLLQQSMTAITSQRDYYLITACRSFEEAIAFDFEKHDVFTGALIDGLSVENAGEDRQISGDRLFDYISSTLKGSKQEPIRMGWGRSITLVTYPQEEITTEEVAFNTENPYRGLYPFESEQEKYFCGRILAVRALLDRLSSNRFLSVIGPSGCGKSSLVKAGLLPHLERDLLPSSSQWGIETFTPGKHPLTKLIEILDRQHRQNQPFVLFIDQMEEIFTLCEDDVERQSFIRLMADEATNSERITRVIVAIRTDFLDRCAAYPQVANLINRTQPTTYIVAPLFRSELEEAIKEPASLHGVKFERGLISQIADDVDQEPGALPLLQYALKELWRVCIEKPDSPEPHLTAKGYEQIGGVKGALENRANLLYQSFSSTDQLFVYQMFMELVQLGEENTVTRRRTSWERLEAEADSIDQLRRVVELLAGQRLIVTDENTVEVAHEALLTEWTLLRGWIEENRENIRLSRLLETECREWQQRFKKSDEALLTGAKLETLSEWKEKIQPKLPVEEAEFLRKSLAKRDKENQEELEQERQLRELAESRQKETEARAKAEAEKTQMALASARKLRKRAITLGISLLATIASLGVTGIAYWTAKQQGELTEARRLQGLAESVLDKDPMQSLLLSLEIAGRGFKTEASSVLWPSLIAVIEARFLPGHTDNVMQGNFSNNGKYVLTVSVDNTARLWNLEKPEEFKVLKGHKDAVMYGTFSKNAERILTIGYREKAIIWNINNLSKPIILPIANGKLRHGSLSHDGSKVLTVGHAGMTIVWTLDNSGKVINQKQLTQHFATVFYGSFSPTDANKILTVSEDGKVRFIDLANPLNNRTFSHNGPIRYGVFSTKNPNLILTASDDKTARVWNLNKQGNQAIATLPHNGSVGKANFDPNNPNRIITVSSDKTACIWDISKQGNKKLFTLEGHQDIIRHGEFAPTNSSLVITTSNDGTARVWNLAGSKVSVIKDSIVLKGHTGNVYSGSFHPTDHNQIITVGQDDIARIWNLKPFGNPQILLGHSGSINSAVFDPHIQDRILTVSSDSTARVWNLNNPQKNRLLQGHKRAIASGIFAPHDKNLVLTASDDDTAKLWDIKPKVPIIIAEFKHEAEVREASFSPDGKKIVTASYDRTAKTWIVDASGKWSLLRTLKHNGLVEYATFSQKGNLVLTTSRDKTGRVWNPEVSSSPVAIFNHNDLVVYGEFDPNDDNIILTVGYDKVAKLWDLRLPNKQVAEFRGHQGRILRANFSKDSKQILTVSADGTARVWHIQSKTFRELKSHQALVRDGKFHPKDSNLVVTASYDGTVRLWNIGKNQNTSPIVLSGHNDVVLRIDINQNVNPIQIVTASRDGKARLYTIESWDNLLASAWTRASRCLSKEEISSFLIPEERIVPSGSLLARFPKLKSKQDLPMCIK